MRPLLLAAALLSGLAVAAPEGTAEEQAAEGPSERPWARGVSQARQDQALALYREGNELFEQSKHAQALGSYREALKSWDHPAIHFNTAVALITLDQPLEAAEHLEAASRFGELPFGPETWRQAQLYRKLLAGQLSELEVSCAEPGALLTLDGEALLTGPGRAFRRLKPGPHQVVASKPGFATVAQTWQLEAGGKRSETVTLELARVQPVHLVQRWPSWMPWTVLGSGALLGALGAPLYLGARQSYASYDADLSRLCPTGCATTAVPATVLAARDTGRLQNGAAIGLFSAGAALAATGAVLVVLNLPRPEEPPATPKLTVAPVLALGTAGVWARVEF